MIDQHLANRDLDDAILSPVDAPPADARVVIVGAGIIGASVAEVARAGGGDGLDPRRFRMLVELDGLDPFEEDRWSGAVVRVGAATLRFGGRVPRCVMTTLHPDTGVQDVDTLAMLAVDRTIDGKLRLGVYGDVLEPGVIGLGDPVEVLATV